MKTVLPVTKIISTHSHQTPHSKHPHHQHIYRYTKNFVTREEEVVLKVAHPVARNMLKGVRYSISPCRCVYHLGGPYKLALVEARKPNPGLLINNINPPCRKT